MEAYPVFPDRLFLDICVAADFSANKDEKNNVYIVCKEKMAWGYIYKTAHYGELLLWRQLITATAFHARTHMQTQDLYLQKIPNNWIVTYNAHCNVYCVQP